MQRNDFSYEAYTSVSVTATLAAPVLVSMVLYQGEQNEGSASQRLAKTGCNSRLGLVHIVLMVGAGTHCTHGWDWYTLY